MTWIPLYIWFWYIISQATTEDWVLINLMFCRYTDSVMNYQPMGPGAQSFAQFYHQAALTSAASAGVGGDSLGKF